MFTVIDKVRRVSGSNIPTVGFQTLLLLATSSTTYTGNRADDEALKAGITVKVSDTSGDANAVAINSEYIQARTQGGSTNVFIEVVLTKAFVTSITLPAGLTVDAMLLTNPSNSETNKGA